MLILICCNSLVAQQSLGVSDYVFVCESKIEDPIVSITNGATAFELHIEKRAEWVIVDREKRYNLFPFLELLDDYLNEHPKKVLALLFKGEYSLKELKQYLKGLPFNVYLKQANWPELDSIVANKSNLIAVFKDEFVQTSKQQLDATFLYEKRFSAEPLKKLIQYNSSNTDSLLQNCLSAWQKTGKVPNFLMSSTDLANYKKVADSLNSLRRFRGEIRYKDKLLNEVYWANSPGVITAAVFSFPLLKEEQILLPIKNGYRFSPGEVIHHNSMSDATRKLSAYDIALNKNLKYNFLFNKGFLDQINPTYKNAIIKKVTITNDPERGKVLKLDTPDSYIDLSKENGLNFDKTFSVSVWIKPAKRTQFMGVVGIGSAFSLKLFNGKPDFTTATIKDHVVEKKFELHEWQHLVVVFNPGTKVEFYVDGIKVGVAAASEILATDQSLVIGNNIWGEQFYGSIDDLKIWNRGLSNTEVELLYTSVKYESNNLLLWIIATVFILFIFSFLVYKFKKGQSKRVRLPKIQVKETIAINRVQLFGKFGFLYEGKEFSSIFSPLLRQILLYLILKTSENSKGVATIEFTEVFWPGMPKNKAKENRSANIQKLRKILKQFSGLEVVFENKKWRIVIEDTWGIDVLEYQLLKQEIQGTLETKDWNKTVLGKFISLLQPGNILQNTNVEWADFYKNRMCKEVDMLLFKCYKLHVKSFSLEEIRNLSNIILKFDSLNEEALAILLKALVESGKHGYAEQVYNEFAKNYQSLYATKFTVSYQSIVNK